MGKRKKKESVKREEKWHCRNCDVDILIVDDRKPVLDHLKTAHDIDGATVKASKQIEMALDFKDSYENSFSWTWRPTSDPSSFVVMGQTQRGPRDMSWGG